MSGKTIGFTDSVAGNREMLRELLGGIPPGSRERAKRAAVALENTFERLKKDFPRDPAVALGMAFAVYTLAERMVEQDQSSSDGAGGLIHLLS